MSVDAPALHPRGTSHEPTRQTCPFPRSRSLDSLCTDNGFVADMPCEGPDVWLHIYHCDPYTGFLNRMMLKHAEIGIYHAGVEVFGEEWSFQYFEDTWSDPSVSGLIRCEPRRMAEYEYQESINLGPTPFLHDEVDSLLLILRKEWPACSYHLTHRNCLTFAEHFIGLLQVPRPFPVWLKGILEASRVNSSLDGVVNYSWSWAKWWMMRKHHREDEDQILAGLPGHIDREEAAIASDDRVSTQQVGLWSALLQPTMVCSGSVLCPAGPRHGNRLGDPPAVAASISKREEDIVV